MKALILLASAGAFAIAAPAAAKPHHSSHWGRHDNGHHYGRTKHRQLYNRGQHWRSNYGTLYTYNRIPYSVRHRYNLNRRYRYYYSNGYYYAVDPTTQVVQQVISSLLR
jgi:hypothetical protein